MVGLRRRGARVLRIGRPGEGGGERWSGMGEESVSASLEHGDSVCGEGGKEGMASTGMMGEGWSPLLPSSPKLAGGEEGMVMVNGGGEMGVGS